MSHERAATCPARFGRRSGHKRDSADLVSILQWREPTEEDAGNLSEDSSRTSASDQVSDYGSWPRARKQRTSESIMSIHELRAAFERAEPSDSPLSVLDATTQQLAESAEAEAEAACDDIDWGALADGGGDTSAVDWAALAADGPGAEDAAVGVDWDVLANTVAAEEAVAEEAAAELVSHAMAIDEEHYDFADLQLEIADLVDAAPAAAPPPAAHMCTLGVGAASVAAAGEPLWAATAPTRRAEKKEWTASEDALIRCGFEAHGCRWRKIASQLPGRSEDAVRNRWQRLQIAAQGAAGGEGGEGAGPSGDYPKRRPSGAGGRQYAGGRQAARAAASGGGAERGASPTADSAGAAKPERLSWTPAEDAIITASVDELGHKWFKIAQRLPGRTEHAIRNRYARLQSAMADALEQRRSAAAALQPLPEFAPEFALPEHAAPLAVAAAGSPVLADSLSAGSLFAAPGPVPVLAMPVEA